MVIIKFWAGKGHAVAYLWRRGETAEEIAVKKVLIIGKKGGWLR